MKQKILKYVSRLSKLKTHHGRVFESGLGSDGDFRIAVCASGCLRQLELIKTRSYIYKHFKYTIQIVYTFHFELYRSRFCCYRYSSFLLHSSFFVFIYTIPWECDRRCRQRSYV
jgi:hypothetical protein